MSSQFYSEWRAKSHSQLHGGLNYNGKYGNGLVEPLQRPRVEFNEWHSRSDRGSCDTVDEDFGILRA